MSDKVVLIVQARMGSSRLPGKSIMDIAGKPLIFRILERLKRIKKIDELILAIPSTKENNVLKNIALSLGVKVFRGSEDDVLDRYYRAAKQFDADIVGRFPADNAAPEPKEIDKIIKFHKNLKFSGFTTNLCQIRNSGYPDGIGAEFFNFNLLKEVWKKNKSSLQREHVHLNFFNYVDDKGVDENWCPINTIDCPIAFKRPDIVLDINTNEQYIFIKNLYDYLFVKNPKFHITDIINWYDNIYKKCDF